MRDRFEEEHLMPTIDPRGLRPILRAIRSREDVGALLAELGYEAIVRPVDPQALKLPHLQDAYVLRNKRARREGYGVLIGITSTPPRTLRPLARAIQREIHDSPLGIIATRMSASLVAGSPS